MSDGGEEGGNWRERVDQIKPTKRSTSSEFGREVAKVAMAQICGSVGFDSLKESALEAMTEIMVRYVSDLGKAANFYANVASRSECNVFDVVQSLEDLGSSAGFSGASKVAPCLTSSGMVREIVEYVGSTEEIPFSQPVPNFPVMRNRALTPSFMKIGETPNSNHIPSWLPAFPDPHTYIHTPMWNERGTDPREDQIALARQRRKAERSLLSLQQRLVSGGSELASTSAQEGVGKKAPHPVEASTNPFLSAPLQAGEKEISSLPLPNGLCNGSAVENHVSVLDTFSPALEAVGSGTFNFDDNGKNHISEERESVQLSFKSSKKVLGEPMDLRIRRKGTKGSHSERIDERDDKKRRAQLILRLSVENPLELTLL